VVKLMDFGIAKSTDDLNLTRPGTTMGSIYYMSPEQVRGGTVDGRSDIYSFGVTLYEMVTGRKPFEAETSYSVLNAQLNEAPAPPAQWNPSLSRELNDIVLQAMAKDPGARFQTAEEFRNALKALHAPKAAGLAAVAAVPVPVSATSVVTPGPVAVPSPNPAPDSAPSSAPGSTPGFAPVPVAVAPPQTKSHRGLWIGLGALAAVLAIVAAATVLPRFYPMHAGQKSGSLLASITGTSAPAGTASTPAPSPGSPTPESLSPAQPSGSTSGNSASVAALDTPGPKASETAVDSAPVSGRVAGSTLANSAPANHAPVDVAIAHPGTAHPVIAHPVLGHQTPAPPAPQPQQVVAPTQSAPPGPSPDEIRHARDRYTDLDARADSVGGQIDQMRRQQQAQGYDLRGDMVGALNRMNNDLHEADRSIHDRDLEAARDYMDKANEELRKLEGFLGH
jgi:serine/threonine-protein kinase